MNNLGMTFARSTLLHGMLEVIQMSRNSSRLYPRKSIGTYFCFRNSAVRGRGISFGLAEMAMQSFNKLQDRAEGEVASSCMTKMNYLSGRIFLYKRRELGVSTLTSPTSLCTWLEHIWIQQPILRTVIIGIVLRTWTTSLILHQKALR